MSKRRGWIIMIFLGAAVFFLFYFAMEEPGQPTPKPTAQVILTKTEVGHTAFLPAVSAPECTTYNARLEITADQLIVKVNETVKVSLTLFNEGCGNLGRPTYQIYPRIIQNLIQLSPTLQPHYFSLASKANDRVVFVFKAGTPGQVELKGDAAFEFHLASGQAALNGDVVSAPITITVVQP